MQYKIRILAIFSVGFFWSLISSAGLYFDGYGYPHAAQVTCSSDVLFTGPGGGPQSYHLTKTLWMTNLPEDQNLNHIKQRCRSTIKNIARSRCRILVEAGTLSYSGAVTSDAFQWYFYEWWGATILEYLIDYNVIMTSGNILGSCKPPRGQHLNGGISDFTDSYGGGANDTNGIDNAIPRESEADLILSDDINDDMDIEVKVEDFRLQR